MRPLWTRAGTLLAVIVAAELLLAQPPTRRLTTIAAIQEFPQYFHLQPVVLRGEFVEHERRFVLRADEHDLSLLNPSAAKGGPVEVRGEVLDVGRLERTDVRLGTYAERFKNEEWPRPGTHLVLNITGVTDAPVATVANVRALALEPWKFEGQTVTVAGNFRGRNLFGDVPAAPGVSRYDFVLSGVDGSLWVTGMRPRGRGFDLDVERRMDSGEWLQVTGVAGRFRGLATITAASLAKTDPPKATAAPTEVAAAPAPSPPVTIVFSSPTPDETDVSPSSNVRIQFSRGLRETSLKDQVRVSYVTDGGVPSPITFKATYDAASRSLRLDFPAPLEPSRSVRVELLESIRAFDNGPFSPWTLTFSVGRR